MDESVVKYLEQPAKLDEASKLLLAAAARIERCGHWAGGADRRNGECVITALMNEGEVRGIEYSTAAMRFALAIGAEGFSTEIHRWNDASDAQTVIAKLRAVALGL